MNRTILTQSIFNTTPAETSSWRSHLTSGAVHAVVILAVFLLVVPTVTKDKPKKIEHITYIAPQLPEYHAKITPPHIQPRPTVSRVEFKPKPVPVIKPPEIKQVPVQPRLVAAAPEIKHPVIAPRILPEPRLEAPAPKPEVHTGTFQSAEAAKNVVVEKNVKTGGFGDPNGLRPATNSSPSSLMMAKVGSFDMPAGSGTSGGGGRGASGGVRQTSFGSVDAGSPNGKGNSGTVQTGGFGDSAASAPVQTQKARPVEPPLTPVEILSKPKPVYSEEARNLKLEGQVSLEVTFLSTGSVRIVRLVRGLGHGLDEAAEQAALQVRFKPATRGGVPVDMNATIKITFELT